MAVEESTPQRSDRDERYPEAVRELLAGVLGETAHTDRLVRLGALEHGAAVARGGESPALGELEPALAELIDKIARHAYTITDDDVARARAAGCSDDALYDLVVATAVGAGLARRSLGRAAIARWERER